jgi:hypothetical protein
MIFNKKFNIAILANKAPSAREVLDRVKEMKEECKCSRRKCIETNDGAIFGLAVFVVCQKCGNKRCPKASDHRMKCTGSNELNQVGELEDDNR